MESVDDSSVGENSRHRYIKWLLHSYLSVSIAAGKVTWWKVHVITIQWRIDITNFFSVLGRGRVSGNVEAICDIHLTSFLERFFYLFA